MNPLADVWWGGGEYYFELARQQDLFERYNVTEDVNITAYLGGWHLKDDSDPSLDPAWYAAALSGFGIMYNTEYLTAEGLSVPTSWDDLANYSYFGHISMADPDFSGSTVAIVKQILQYKSDAFDEVEWTTNVTEGWQYWLEVSGNVGTFTTNSAAVPTAVADGNAGIGLCIDYYAYDRMKTDTKLGFTYGGATTVAPDPVGILKGATNLDPAKAFMDDLTSTEGQTLVGDYRTPSNFKADTASLIPKAFDSSGNPTASFPAITPFSPYLDGRIHSRIESLFTNWIVQNHEKVKTAWDQIWTKMYYTVRDDALALYTKLPSDCNGTIAGLRALEYNNAAVIDLWRTEAGTNFDAIFSFTSPDFILIDSSLSPSAPGVYQFAATIKNIGGSATTSNVPISWEKYVYGLPLVNGIGTLDESVADYDINGDGVKDDTFTVEWNNTLRPWDAEIDGDYVYAFSDHSENRGFNRTYSINGETKLFHLGSKMHSLYWANNIEAYFGFDAVILNHPSPNFELVVYSNVSVIDFQINSEFVELNHTTTNVEVWTDGIPRVFTANVVPTQAAIGTNEQIEFSCIIIARETKTCQVALLTNWSPDGNIRYRWIPFDQGDVSFEAPPICEDNPPDVTITGIEDSGTYSGTITIEVSATDESDIVNATIQIKYGVIDETYDIDLDLAAGTWTGSYDLDTTAFPDETYDVSIRVYDVCDNVKTIRLDITINNDNEPDTTSATEVHSVPTPGLEIPLILMLFTCSIILRRKFYSH